MAKIKFIGETDDEFTTGEIYELCDFKINTTIDNHLKLEIKTFNPSDGTGTDYIYIIKRVLESKGE